MVLGVRRYLAAVELLGERDEALDELRNDLMDVKNLYREQIDWLIARLQEAAPGSLACQPPASAPECSTRAPHAAPRTDDVAEEERAQLVLGGELVQQGVRGVGGG